MFPMILCADVHLSSRKIMGRSHLDAGMAVLQQIYELARNRGINHVGILGDLLDNKYQIPLEVLIRLHNFFQDHRDVRWTWLKGNHETPDRADPHKSILTLYEDLCEIRIAPMKTSLSGGVLIWMPWYPQDQYLDALRIATAGLNRPAILLTHLGLKEGSVSNSNFHVHSKIGVEELFSVYPWKSVFLGDFHMRQQVGQRPCFYLGATHAHEFGEIGHGCYIWEGFDRVPQQVALDAPAFRIWSDDALDGIHPRDYNRIVTRDEARVALLQEAHPYAEVVLKTEEAEEASPPRLNDQDELPLLMQQYLAYRGLDEEPYMTAGMKLLETLRSTVG